MVYLILF